MYALMYPILYIASIHCYIPLSTATSMSVCSVCIVLWHDHVNGEIEALKKNNNKKKNISFITWMIYYVHIKLWDVITHLCIIFDECVALVSNHIPLLICGCNYLSLSHPS